MRHTRSTLRVARLTALVVAFAIAAGALAGCGSEPESQVSTSTSVAAGVGSAKSGVDRAQSALSTMAPDAKLLLVQTAMSMSPTSSPAWAYLFGSQKNNKTYVVYSQGEAVMQSSEYGEADLTKSQWGEVPTLDAWKVDSDVAYVNALKASGFKGVPSAFNMGFLTYIPSDDTTSTAKEFVWYVTLAPSQSGEATASIMVDAKTGQVITE